MTPTLLGKFKVTLSVIALFILTTVNVVAQNSNVIVFAEQGEKFTMILNGLRQNETPQTNVKVADVPAAGYKMKVIFADENLGQKDFNLFLEPGMERTFNIKKNNKGEYVLRFVSEVPLAQAPPAPPAQQVIIYGAAPAPVESQTTVIQQTTTTSGGAPSTEVSMGVHVSETGGTINMNVSGMETETYNSTTTTTTSTTVISSGTAPAPAVAPVPVSYLPGYNGPVGCAMPMAPGDFSSVKNSIASKSFEDSKLTIAKQVIGANCLLTSQVRDIMLLFSFEDTRLTLAKYAYGYTYDIGNYYQLNDAFTFEHSIDELNAYINAQR